MSRTLPHLRKKNPYSLTATIVGLLPCVGAGVPQAGASLRAVFKPELGNEDKWFVDAMAKTRKRRNLAIWAYVIMPEHGHIIVSPKKEEYDVRLIRTGLKIPVQRKALRFLSENASEFLKKLRDEQPNGKVHYRFWQRGGGYDRTITNPSALKQMIEYIH